MNLQIKDIIKILYAPFFVYMLGYTLEVAYPSYHILWWPNRLVHFLGGLSIAISVYYIFNLFKKADYIKTVNFVFDALIVILAVMSVTVVWEFYEFLSDTYLYTHSQPNVADVMGMLGAAFFATAWMLSKVIMIRRSSIKMEINKIEIKTTVK